MITTENKLFLPQIPLKNFKLFEDKNIDILEATSTDWFTPCRILTASEVGERNKTSLYAADLGPIKLVFAHGSGSELDVLYTQKEENFIIMFPVVGASKISVGDEKNAYVAEHGAIISPTMRPRIQLSAHYSQLHLRIDRAALERHLERMLGVAVIRPVQFQMSIDLKKPAMTSWIQTIQLLVKDLGTSSGLSASAVGVQPWSDLLMTGLLLAQPHNYSSHLAQTMKNQYRPPSLKRALDFINTDPSHRLTLSQISSVAGVSIRTLQREFRDYVGVTPGEYIQWIRLCRAHDDLTSGNGNTVTEIALRWGFSHVSRFSAAYRKRYGQLPSKTLQDSHLQHDTMAHNGKTDSPASFEPRQQPLPHNKPSA